MLSLFRRLSDDFRPACSTWHEASLISSKDAFRLDVVLFDESFPEVKEHLKVFRRSLCFSMKRAIQFFPTPVNILPNRARRMKLMCSSRV